jgi:hypothetical protein
VDIAVGYPHAMAVAARPARDNRRRDAAVEKPAASVEPWPPGGDNDPCEYRNRGNHMNTTELTADERRLAEGYQGVLTEVARCAQAIRDGDWSQLAATATDLSRSAVLLAVAAGEPREPTTPPRVDKVLDAATGHHATPITRILHPTRPAALAKTTITDPSTHPGT